MKIITLKVTTECATAASTTKMNTMHRRRMKNRRHCTAMRPLQFLFLTTISTTSIILLLLLILLPANIAASNALLSKTSISSSSDNHNSVFNDNNNDNSIHVDEYDYLSTDSELGKMVLSQSTRYLNNNNNNNNNNDDGYVDYSWMAKFSLKFQGCNNIQQWNTALDDEDDDDNDINVPRIRTARIARFRLCPSRICSSRKSQGCSKGYGDYIVDVDTYVSAYVKAQREKNEYECQKYIYKKCECQDDETDDTDLCEYKCLMKGRKYDCIEQNPYYDDDSNNRGLYRNDLRDFEKYFNGCSEFEFEDDDRRTRRKLEDSGDDDISYYIGLYCADQGGKIYLGMFTDDTCTNFADKNAGRTTYKELTGHNLPFSDKSMVRTECISCRDRGRNNRNHNNNNDNDVRINDECQEVYQSSGKCETEMTKNGPSALNNRSCYFIGGIKLVRKDGFIDTNFTRPNKTFSFFIFFFAVSFVLLGAYIYYLRMSKYKARSPQVP